MVALSRWRSSLSVCLVFALVAAGNVDAATVSRRHHTRRHHKEVAVVDVPQDEQDLALLATGSETQEETAMSSAVAAAADLDAEAVVQQAEQEAGEQPAQAEADAADAAREAPLTPAQQQRQQQSIASVPQATNVMVAENAKQQQQTGVAAAGSQATDSDDEDDDEGDDDDDDAKTELDYKIQPKAEPTEPAQAPPASSPGAGKTTEVTYGVHDGVLRGESLTPQGRLTKARQRLQDNLFQQTKVNSLIWQMGNETEFQSDVDAEANDLSRETNAKALATMLSGMRKEMRKFAQPFYLEHLVGERRRLKAQEKILQAELDAAEAACLGGHQGYPHPGDKVVVAESKFRRPALRGGEGGDSEDDDDEVKRLKISIPKLDTDDSSLLQTKKHSPAEKSGGAAAAPTLARAAGAVLGCALMNLLM